MAFRGAQMVAGLKVGAVAYLNARPLIEGLPDRLPGSSLVLDHPSRLAEALALGTIDVGLIPSVEYLRGAGRGYRIVPGISIAARGPVRSVKLFCRVPVGQIRRLALDDSSRTSQVLARVWLADAHGVHPPLIESLPIGISPLESTADAVVAIGDAAMRTPDHGFAAVFDLAKAWHGLTGLPFVFALWVVRAGVDAAGLTEALVDCRAAGLAAAGAIAQQHGARLGLDRAACFQYLTQILSYNLGPDELAGLRAFAERAAALELAPEGAELDFVEGRRNLAAQR